jgi:hypothetical protein
MKNIKYETKKLINISINLVTTTKPISDEYIKNKNINFLFSKTIHSMKICIDTYDKCFMAYEDEKKSIEENHKVAFIFIINRII